MQVDGNNKSAIQSNFNFNEKKESAQIDRIGRVRANFLEARDRYEAQGKLKDLPINAGVYYPSSRVPEMLCFLENYPGARHIEDPNALKVELVPINPSLPKGQIKVELEKWIEERLPSRMQPYESQEEALKSVSEDNIYAFWFKKDGNQAYGLTSDCFGISFQQNSWLNNVQHCIGQWNIDGVSFDTRKVSFPVFRLAMIEERLGLINSLYKAFAELQCENFEEAKQKIENLFRFLDLDEKNAHYFKPIAFYVDENKNLQMVYKLRDSEYRVYEVKREDKAHLDRIREILIEDWKKYIKKDHISPSRVNNPANLSAFEISADPVGLKRIVDQQNNRNVAVIARR